MSGHDLLAMITAVGFGILSGVFPLANAETFVMASQVSHLAGPVPIAVGVAVGQTLGKALLFLGVRRGREFHFFRRHRERAEYRPVGPTRRRLRLAIRWLLALVGSRRWGLPITFCAAVVGIPPIYPVALLAGATTMRLRHFVSIVLVGRLIRFILIALGIADLLTW